jgi:K(+)-stimulated pyrophosphate-energized sodium pump
MIALAAGLLGLVGLIWFNRGSSFGLWALGSACLVLLFGFTLSKIPSFNIYWLIIPIVVILCCGVGGLVFLLTRKSNNAVKKISEKIKSACSKFLLTQYLIIGGILLLVSSLLMVFKGAMSGFLCLVGGATVILCGATAMKISSFTSERILEAVSKGKTSDGLRIGILSGASSVLLTHSMGALAGAFCHVILQLRGLTSPVKSLYVLLGSSLVALLARTCGGIFTKAADVSGDLVGKLQNDLPEDDIKNPACIADNTGDHVGDVMSSVSGLTNGILISFFTSFATFTNSSVGILMLFGGLFTGILSAVGSYLFPKVKNFVAINLNLTTINLLFLLGGARIFGVLDRTKFLLMISGVILGHLAYAFSNYYTDRNRPVMDLVGASKFGGGTNVISGLSLAWGAAEKYSLLLFGAVGALTLASLGWVNSSGTMIMSMLHRWQFCFFLACGMAMRAFSVQVRDLIGAPADNAGGLAEMGKFPAKIREETDKLDIVGNSTKAGTKVFDLLLTLFLGIAMFLRYFGTGPMGIAIGGFGQYLFNIIGGLLGAGLVFGFLSRTMGSVSTLAQIVAQKIITQFKNKPGILKGTEEADHQEIIGFITGQAMFKALPAIVIPVAILGLFALVWYFLSTNFTAVVFSTIVLNAGISAFILSIISGVYLCIGGGAFDNAKKTIEAEGKKNSPKHKAAVIGDTLGDPMKDTTGPAVITFGAFVLTITVLISGLFK